MRGGAEEGRLDPEAVDEVLRGLLAGSLTGASAGHALTGSDEPYRPTYAKLSKKDEESLRQHAESLRQSRAAHTG